MIRPDLEKGLKELDLSISDKSIQMFEKFSTELIKWNKKINLTSILNDSDIAVKHIIDSIIFSSYIHSSEYVLDIGSGAGIPAIPLKILIPEINVVSVDAVGKKILFQRHVARLLGLKGFEAIHARVENLLSTHACLFDVISSRAFSKLDVFVSLAAPLLKSGGRLIAMKGPGVLDEIDSVKDKICLLGFEITSIQEYSLPLSKGSRSLVTISALKAYK